MELSPVGLVLRFLRQPGTGLVAAGSASALIGVIQFACGAVMAPIVGLGGISALPMAIAMAVLGPAAIVAVWLGRVRWGRP